MTQNTILQNFLPILAVFSLLSLANGLEGDPTEFYGLRIQGEHESTLPLVSQDVDVRIHGSLAIVKLSQKYRNPFSKNIETEYLFPKSEKSTLYKLEATYDNVTIRGKILEKEQAKEEYEINKEKGCTVAYAEIVGELHDVMKVKIGNLRPEAEILVSFSYIEPLRVELNSLWSFTFYSTLTPRYTPARQAVDAPDITTQHSTAFKMNSSISVTVYSNSPITHLRSTSHPIQANYSTNRSDVTLKLESDATSAPIFNRDFVLYFRNDEVFKPQVYLAKHPKFEGDYLAFLSFFPAFNSFSVEDVIGFLAKESKVDLYLASIDQDIASSKGEFVFIVDRSGSMDGARVENMKKALAGFLDVLPVDSYFNVISFGYSSEKMFNTSQKTTKESIKAAKTQIKTFEANFGGTEILTPIVEATEQLAEIKGYPRKIFLLTDGDVTNSDSIIKYVKRSAGKFRYCSVGIGNGISPYLITRIGEFGKCGHEFVKDDEDLGEKAKKLLHNSISHFLEDIKVEIDVEHAPIVVETIPLLDEIPRVLKNEPFELWMKLNLLNVTAGDNMKITVSYFNSYNNKSETQPVTLRLSDNMTNEAFHKLYTSKKISKLEDAKSTNPYDKNNLNAKIVELSLKYQVLSEQTAFLCVVTDPLDDLKDDASMTIKIPNIQAHDYAEVSFKQAHANYGGRPMRRLSAELGDSLVMDIASIEMVEIEMPSPSGSAPDELEDEVGGSVLPPDSPEHVIPHPSVEISPQGNQHVGEQVSPDKTENSPTETKILIESIGSYPRKETSAMLGYSGISWLAVVLCLFIVSN